MIVFMLQSYNYYIYLLNYLTFGVASSAFSFPLLRCSVQSLTYNDTVWKVCNAASPGEILQIAI